MTKNQIAYHTLRENMRHNRINEVENERNNREYNATRFDANQKKYDASMYATRENIRHNRVNEKETNRHNLNDETIGYFNASANLSKAASNWVNVFHEAANTNNTVNSNSYPSSYSPSTPAYGEVPF